MKCWRYVDTKQNPADVITRGATLSTLLQANLYSNGPDFLLQSEEEWPSQPAATEAQDEPELKRSLFCGLSQAPAIERPDLDNCSSMEDLERKTFLWHHKDLPDTTNLSAADYAEADCFVLRRAQMDSFPEDLECLQKGKPVPSDSRLLTLAPELNSHGPIRVGG